MCPLLQDLILAELLQNNKDQIVCYHEHDSLLDHKEEEELSEEDRKAAWAEYEAEKKVGNNKNPYTTHRPPQPQRSACKMDHLSQSGPVRSGREVLLSTEGL